MEQEKRPTTIMQRITVIDALRGFALLGVILMHMLQHFGIYSDVRPEEAKFPMIDQAIQWLSAHVIMGRFINIFACLFGLSFFIQMDRAARRGVDFRMRFLWRMVILFMIGMVGNAFFTADILSIYAVFGAILVFLFPLKNWILLLLAALLLVGTPRIVMTGVNQLGKTTAPTEQPTEARRTNVTARTNNDRGSFLMSAKENYTTRLQSKLNYQFGMYGRGYLTMALFILGFVVGRLRFFEEVQIKQRRNVLLLLLFTLAFGATKLLLDFIPVEPLSFRMLLNPKLEISPAALAVTALNDISIVLFSSILAMGFIVLYQIKSVGKYLDLITPYGRMGLTNYEMQGIIGATLFSMWGFGEIFGRWGTTEVFMLGLLCYALQVIFSKLWLDRLLYGPLEWFWRSSTYLKIQPIRKKTYLYNQV